MSVALHTPYQDQHPSGLGLPLTLPGFCFQSKLVQHPVWSRFNGCGRGNRQAHPTADIWQSVHQLAVLPLGIHTHFPALPLALHAYFSALPLALHTHFPALPMALHAYFPTLPLTGPPHPLPCLTTGPPHLLPGLTITWPSTPTSLPLHTYFPMWLKPHYPLWYLVIMYDIINDAFAKQVTTNSGWLVLRFQATAPKWSSLVYNT